MPPVSRSSFLLLALVAAAAGCGTTETQWFKPGQNYTVAEFQRDHKACTKKGELDEGCMRQRGWVSLSGDAAPKPKTLEEQERERRGSTGGLAGHALQALTSPRSAGCRRDLTTCPPIEALPSRA